ncbi:hypothetical protein [Aquitalea pelogenes]|uniref:hypothetical protein n=1 Tax=Aquitalea pelogenes TaxID=1293573 RepID=UPI0035AEEF8A
MRKYFIVTVFIFWAVTFSFSSFAPAGLLLPHWLEAFLLGDFIAIPIAAFLYSVALNRKKGVVGVKLIFGADFVQVMIRILILPLLAIAGCFIYSIYLSQSTGADLYGYQDLLVHSLVFGLNGCSVYYLRGMFDS